MKNIIEIDGVKAELSYDEGLLRGDFIGLNGGADFYADNIKDLLKEGAISLRVFKECCDETGLEYFKHFSGKFNVRISPELHQKVNALAASQNTSLNAVVTKAIEAL